jgi:phosphopantetheinyl transferase (holo-ACP synthase)
MGKDCQGITVHTVNFDHRGGSAFYASLPGDGKTVKGCRANAEGDKNRLVSFLLDHIATMGNPLWECLYLLDRAAFPIHVIRGPLGRPHLLLGKHRGPAISFSEGGGKVWAALCGDASDIGIDVAETDEFQGEYPFSRVFHDHELQHALKLTGGDLGKASALLWSIKEAVVKAIGCAFHLVAPRQVHIYPSTGGNGGYIFPVCLSRKALVRSNLDTCHSIWVRSFPQANRWLSIALLSRQSR